MRPLLCLTALISCVVSIPLYGSALDAAVTVDLTQAGTWSYTVINAEPPGSPNYIFTFLVDIDAPVVVTSIPEGWGVDTNNTTFVIWFNTDAALPYPHDIAPGSSLGGFSISSPDALSSLQFSTLASWDHAQDQPGPLSNPQLTTAPSSPAPEPSLYPALAILWVALSLYGLTSRRRCAKKGQSNSHTVRFPVEFGLLLKLFH